MKSFELRHKFLQYFEEHGHKVLPSSAVIPQNDPTLLFANAGMNQFKEVFLGHEVRDYKRAATAQKCVRAGGKHNDLDEVGKDGRHLTFFEMLGNWSFGDYGKSGAIRFAWEFLTQPLGLPAERLYVSIYKDDEESYKVWTQEIGLAPERIVRLGDIEKGDEENFWSMGPCGPCGPCTEIYIDKTPNEPFAWSTKFPEDRYIELWNIVFMTFDRAQSGKLSNLSMRSVDTGMGLERICAVMQGVESVYETDLFKEIIEHTSRLLGTNLTREQVLASDDSVAYRVIADHIRTLTFAVSEGQPFSNEGRGYVLRRILRRAVRFGRELGFKEPFLCNVSEAVVSTFKDVYPELELVASQTREVLRIEEERFFRTIDRGIEKFEEAAERAKDGVIDGRDAFQLYDTFGFPIDLTQIMAEERKMTVDLAAFEAAFEEQRKRSGDAAKFYKSCDIPWEILHEGQSSEFSGYDRAEDISHVIRYRAIEDGYEIILKRTPFYAESGGPVGDVGVLSNSKVKFRVSDTQKIEGGIVHICELEEGFVNRETMSRDFKAAVDANHRRDVSANHTATHLLHAALRRILGAEVYQAGSLVRPDRLRFDFTFSRPVSPEELQAIEDDVNEKISLAIDLVKFVDMPVEDAKKRGAMAIFGEKYGDKVRVVEVPGCSTELCGGIHVSNTSHIRTFRILQESGIAAGTRRIEAVTGEGALASYREDRERLRKAAEIVRVDTPDALCARLEKLVGELAEVRRIADTLNRRLATARLDGIVATGKTFGEITVCRARVDVNERKDLLIYADALRDRMKVGVALIGAVIDGAPALVCTCTDAAVKLGCHAGKLVGACAEVIGGKGGGRPNSAQAGGKDAEKLDAALDKIYTLFRFGGSGLEIA